MIDRASAVSIAVDLLHLPSRVRWHQSAALPSDVITILEIAAGEPGVLQRAAAVAGHAPDVVERAAQFFVEQVILSAHSDSYRLLAATSTASAADLRRHMALLMRWLHPDRHAKATQALYVTRVSNAWADLKTADRRQAYDALRASQSSKPEAARDLALLSRRTLKQRLVKAGAMPALVVRRPDRPRTPPHASEPGAAAVSIPAGRFRRALRKFGLRLGLG